MTEIVDVKFTCSECKTEFPVELDHTWDKYVTVEAITKKKLFGNKKILQMNIKREEFECPSCHQLNTVNFKILIENPTQKGLEIWMLAAEKKKQRD